MAWSYQRVMRPRQQRLALAPATENIAGIAIDANLPGMPAERQLIDRQDLSRIGGTAVPHHGAKSLDRSKRYRPQVRRAPIKLT